MPAKTACATLAALLMSAGMARANSPWLHYAGTLGGVEVFDADAALDVQPASYRLQLGWRLVGALSVLFHGSGTSVADGRFANGQALPREMFSSGQTRGRPRIVQLDWTGDQARVSQLVPALEKDREKVPEAALAGAIDGLSAMAVLLHNAAETGRCDGQARIFDGRRLTAVTVSTAGMEVPPGHGGAGVGGPALRCDIESRLLAGFQRDDGEEARREPGHAVAWLARVGGFLVPVRVELRNRHFPDVVLALTGSG